MDRKDVINIARRFKEAVCEKYKPIEECHPSPLYEEILRSGILIS